MPDKEVRAYTVENVAYSVSLNLCEYEYSDDIPPVNLEKTWYTSKELLTGQVRPVFDGGTLLFGKNALYSDDNFVVNNVTGNVIHNNNLNIELRGVLSGQGGLSFLGNGTTTLSGANSYIGDADILSGIFKVTGSLSNVTAVSVSQGAVYKVARVGAAASRLIAGPTISMCRDCSEQQDSAASSGGRLMSTGPSTQQEQLRAKSPLVRWLEH